MRIFIVHTRPVVNLDENIRKGVIYISYVRDINRILSSANNIITKQKFIRAIYQIPKFNSILNMLHCPDPYNINNTQGKAYNAYRTLKPIESFIRKRNSAYK